MNDDKKWLEVAIPVDDESREAVANFLFESGSQGLHEDADTVRAFFDASVVEEDLRVSVEAYIRLLRDQGAGVGQVATRWMEAEDWGEGWRRYFKPVRVTPRIVVKPPWESWEPMPEAVVIDIMPRMAFGTGTHETTQLCLEMMEERVSPGISVLDAGTGSGILAVAAAKLGASRVLGVDIDDAAMGNALENADLNGVAECVEVRTGSLDTVGSETFDLIVANINRSVLEHMIPRFTDRFRCPGVLILSGLLTTEASVIVRMLVSIGYEHLEQKEKGEWTGIAARLL